LNNWLASYGRLCERTGFDLPAMESPIIFLRENEVIRITKHARAKHLEVAQGTVWLTGSPANGDVLLHEGERFSFTDNWPFVVQAIGPARIVLLS
jgi:hypothetical protein